MMSDDDMFGHDADKYDDGDDDIMVTMMIY